MKRIAVDTGILIRIIKGLKGPMDDVERNQTILSMALQRADDVQLLMPAPALAEAVGGVGKDQAKQVKALLLSQFRVIELDAEAAWRLVGVGAGLVDGRGSEVSRQQVKYDALIMACAVEAGCDGIAVFDGDHHRLAGIFESDIVVDSPARWAPHPSLPGLDPAETVDMLKVSRAKTKKRGKASKT